MAADATGTMAKTASAAAVDSAETVPVAPPAYSLALDTAKFCHDILNTPAFGMVHDRARELQAEAEAVLAVSNVISQ